jgi:hypothetical protein
MIMAGYSYENVINNYDYIIKYNGPTIIWYFGSYILLMSNIIGILFINRTISKIL